jgi:TolB-like protein/DNA-binding winged helix-turn-helix (wHTH) protein/Flp pilus assembly protein TadD
MVPPQLLEMTAIAVVLSERAQAVMVSLAKKLYFPKTYQESRVCMDNILRNGFRVGTRRVSPLEGWIEGPNGIEHVQPKVIDVLLCLARHAGEVVERDVVIDEVWDGRPATDDVLTRCISELRQALDDDTGDPTFIQTIPKRSYRLIAEVTRDPGIGDDREPASISGSLWDELKQRKVVRVAIAYAAMSWLLLQVADIIFKALNLPYWSMSVFLFVLGVGFLVSVVVAWIYQVVPEEDFAGIRNDPRLNHFVDLAIIGVLVVGVSLLFYRQFIDDEIFPNVRSSSGKITAPAIDRNSIAVLRFASFGGDTAISNGLAENLLNFFSRVSGLKVPSRRETWALSDRNLDAKTIARALRVRYLLDGSVQQKDERITVIAQLIDGSTGENVWDSHFEEQLTANNYFKIQRAIAQQVIDQFDVTGGGGDVTQPASRRTANSEALAHYLEGRQQLNQPKSDPSLTAAVAAFAGLCEAHLAWYVIYRDTGYFDAAESACIRGLRIDQDLGEVYAALGSLHRYAGQYEASEKELVEARRLRNDPAIVLEELGRTYRARRKLILAEQTFNAAIVKDPGNWSVYKSMANFLYRTGRYLEALPYYKQVVVLQQDSSIAYSNIGAAFFMLGKFDSATLAYRQSLELERPPLCIHKLRQCAVLRRQVRRVG